MPNRCFPSSNSFKRNVLYYRSALTSEIHRRPIHCTAPRAKETFICRVDAEPLHRYKWGGYHPIHLGATLKANRYKVLHKLGWGGYSTVWLARDQQLKRSVAIKIIVSELGPQHLEISILHRLKNGDAKHPGRENVVELLDSFELSGPNGTHQCLVVELLGPSIPSIAETYQSHRLPGRLAIDVTRQVVQALAYVHQTGIVHGDLHPANIAISDNTIFQKTGTELLHLLGPPTKGDIQATSGHTLTNHIPQYLVLPTTLPPPKLSSWETTTIKLLDFGSSFPSDTQSPNQRSPLPYRAPEAVLTQNWDQPADIWSLACTIFTLIIGHPPFDAFLHNEKELMAQWIATFGPLPPKWTKAVGPIESADLEITDLAEWMRETYYDEDKKPYFTESELEEISDMLMTLFRYRPEERPTAEDLRGCKFFEPGALGEGMTR